VLDGFVGFHDPLHRRCDCRALYPNDDCVGRVERLLVSCRHQFLDSVDALGRFYLAVADSRDDLGPRRRERERFEFRLEFVEFAPLDRWFRLVAPLELCDDVAFALASIGVLGLLVSASFVVCHSLP
jgi:hypothetical protein